MTAGAQRGRTNRWLAVAVIVILAIVALLVTCTCKKKQPAVANTDGKGEMPSAPGSGEPGKPGPQPQPAPPMSQDGGPNGSAAPGSEELPLDPAAAMPEESMSTSAEAVPDKPVKVMIEGRADIYSAGLAKTDADRGGRLPAALKLASPTGTITFLGVAGKAGCAAEAAYGADGGDCVGGNTDLAPAGGISGIVAHERSLFLVGVFLGAAVRATPPATLDFSAKTLGVAFTELSPLIGQVFFIGDGVTGTGSGDRQVFKIPAGATHLYLGYADGPAFQGAPGNYGDNTGGLRATIVHSK